MSTDQHRPKRPWGRMLVVVTALLVVASGCELAATWTPAGTDDSVPERPDRVSLSDVACPDTAACVAIGTQQTVPGSTPQLLVLRQVGPGWQRLDVPAGTSQLLRVGCHAVDDCVIERDARGPPRRARVRDDDPRHDAPPTSPASGPSTASRLVASRSGPTRHVPGTGPRGRRTSRCPTTSRRSTVSWPARPSTTACSSPPTSGSRSRSTRRRGCRRRSGTAPDGPRPPRSTTDAHARPRLRDGDDLLRRRRQPLGAVLAERGAGRAARRRRHVVEPGAADVPERPAHRGAVGLVRVGDLVLRAVGGRCGPRTRTELRRPLGRLDVDRHADLGGAHGVEARLLGPRHVRCGGRWGVAAAAGAAVTDLPLPTGTSPALDLESPRLRHPGHVRRHRVRRAARRRGLRRVHRGAPAVGRDGAAPRAGHRQLRPRKRRAVAPTAASWPATAAATSC